MNDIRQGFSLLTMTPTRHRQLDSLRHPTSYAFAIVPRNKQTMVANSKNSLFKSIGFVLIMAQCFGLMPVNGVLAKDISFLHFKWFSPKTMYSIIGISGIMFSTSLYVVQFINNGNAFSDIVNIVFFLSAAINIWLFILLARKWSNLNEKWRNVEYCMRYYSFQPNINLRFKITTGVIMSLALAEHLSSVVKLIFSSSVCPTAKTDPAKAYFANAFAQLFSIVPFSGWYALIMELIIIISTFTWNFTNVFIILMCGALGERFKQVNKRVKNTKNKTESFWREIREDYTRLAILCKTLDNAINHIVTVAFGNNLFFICVQLFRTSQPFGGIGDVSYFLSSFGFLLGRTAVLSTYCCWINDESKKTLTNLHEIPSENFGVEASRLIQQITFYPVVITGSNYFAVTRELCLQVAGAIVTFELILLQMGPMLVKTDETKSTLCVI